MDLSKYIQRRAQIKARVTRLRTFFEAIEDQPADIKQLKLRLSKLEPSWNEFDVVQSEIEVLNDSPEQLNERELFENSYFQLVASIETFIEEHSAPACEVTSTVPSIQEDIVSNINIKLPTINLPTFNGTFQEWLPFVDTFTSLIDDNSTLSVIQKFYYLKSSLKGDAAHIIESLPTSNDNYAVAWELLRERFENKRILIQSHVKGIFSLPTSTKESSVSIRELCDGLHKHLRALEMLEQPTTYWDTLLLHIISNKMDPVTRREWETKLPSGDLPTLQEMMQFLKDKCQILETLDFKTKADIKYVPKPRTTSHVSTSSPARDIVCDFCNGKHLTYNCESLLKLSETKRFQEVKARKLCINCLRKNHNADRCRSTSCRKCGKGHHTLLHFTNSTPPKETENVEPTTSTSQSQLLSLSNHSSQQSNSDILLSTARIQICDSTGNIHQCRALLDSGSQSSFITKDLCCKLQLSTKQADVTVSGIGQSVSTIVEEAKIQIHSIHNNFTATLNCLVIDQINQNLPIFYFDASYLELPQKLVLADPTFNKPAQIDVLLGADIFYELLCAGQVRLKKSQPIMQKTVLGWLISGRMTLPTSLPTQPNNKTIHCNFSQIENIQTQLSKFWEIEEPVRHDKQYTRDELLVERHFNETTTKHVDNKFIVKLPFKQCPSVLGESKQTALNRFYSLERRLSKSPELKSQYSNFMKEYEILGHMEKTQTTSRPAEEFFLPHHCVLKDNSETTKLRVVFDGSAKTTSGLSLNDILYTGPTIQDDLFSIIIRFRKHRYVITSDIEKMYRQIWVAKEDRKYQQILWRSNTTEPIVTYSLNTVTYGTTIAPYFATKCLQELALQERHKYPTASNVLLNDFYVDDCLTGAETIQESIKLQQDLTTMLQENGFILRKWRSNEPDIIQHIQLTEPQEAILTIEGDSAKKTLGLLWHSTRDVLQYSVAPITQNQNKITKRQILSIIAQIFDPLGLIGPTIIIAKIILQRLWQYKLGWDEAIPLDLFTSWLTLYQQLAEINTWEIPRHITCTNPDVIELHGFSDASEAAYGACIYIRSVNPQHQPTCHLLCAKSRVSPLKSTTIPRLELCGALLLAQLAQRVKTGIKLHFSKCFYWCDSTITLQWIQAESTRWKTFVANRVSEIHDLTLPQEWRHVRSHDNPADLLSRGSLPKELRTSSIWWNGPSWLTQDADTWPSTTYHQSYEPYQLEVKKTVLIVTHNDIDLVTKFSSFTKLNRVTAYCLRFATNCKSKHGISIQTGPLTVEELTNSMNSLIKIVQMDEFTSEIKNLTTNNEVHRNSKLKGLHPFIDNIGILRVGGRLQNSLYPYNKQHPIVLPSRHKFTVMLIHHTHIKNLHVGPQGLLSILREKYWPISGRNLCKKVVRECIQCFKTNPISHNPLMGDLPTPRIVQSRPFTSTGVDYAGPFLLRERKTRGGKTTKAYICLFVCFATKAIHLELVSDLTTQAFITALRRFVARRGKCTHIYSDNATNFKGASVDLKELSTFVSNQDNQRAMQNAATEDGMTWHFIPARSPHYGGLWEAGVKMTKHHLKRVLGNELLTFEDMYTVLTQIEACLNSRPLSPLSSDPNDLNHLTPAHFLIGEPLTTISDPTLLDLPINRLDRYQHLQRMYQTFWKRWSKEYVAELQLRHKWKESNIHASLQIGDLVLMKDEAAPPLKWRLGRITELHPGADAVVRVATVRTSTGMTTRAVHQLCKLPINAEEDDVESTTFQGGRYVQAPKA